MLLPTTPEYDSHSQQEKDADASMSSLASSSVDRDSRSTKKKIILGRYIVKGWKRVTDVVHEGISWFVLALSLLAARNPKRTIGLVTFVSFALVSVGFLTNFNIQVDYEKVYAPFGCLPMQDKEWIDNESGFPETPRPLTVILHNEGKNVLGMDQVDLLFEALDIIRGTPGYNDICQESTYLNSDGEPECKIFGATRFWDHSPITFYEEIHSNQDAIEAMSAETYPGGVPVYTEFNFGYSEREGDVEDEGGSHNGELLTSAKSYFLRVNFPNTEGVEDFEVLMLERLGALQQRWANNPENPLQLSYFTLLSYDLEFTRAINEDLLLVPFVVLIMSAFTCLVFWKRDRVESRSLLGLGSVAAVGLSLMSGYGLMFVIGVPFTSMTQLLPFVVFGVGLDDTFIIMGSYLRTDSTLDTLQRIRSTMLEVGQSISLTTITTMSAFLLGCMSTIPAIRWVCIYAFPTLFINFVYQLTVFVAFLVLDERRVKANRKDCCLCCGVQVEEEGFKVRGPPSPCGTKMLDDEEESAFSPLSPGGKTLDEEEESASSPLSPCGTKMLEEEESASGPSSPSSTKMLEEEESAPEESPKDERHISRKLEGGRNKSLNERFMSWYATQLLRPWVKALVFVVFLGYFGFCVYCTTNLTQRFRTQDFVPEDSYVADFLESVAGYSEQRMGINVYFRGVNQSDPDVQWEMRRYMHDLMKLPAVNGTEPPFCWVMDFEERKNDPMFELVKDLTFSEKVALALSNPTIREAYGDDIVQDENGTIVASRCWLNPKYLDLDVVNEQIDLLAGQRAVSLEQPANHGGLDDMKFFTYDNLYFIWEFYTVAVNELVFTTVSGIVAVCLVGFILIEHWSATAFVFPMIMLLYVDLLGTLQFAGLYINVVTYVCLVISIGLLVDFLMHIILRYYEASGKTREEKVRETLETMGASILVGGLSTFLGVIPLAFSTSAILRTVFTAFFAMVTLGLTHGLILLPVVLSLVGPTVCIQPHNTDTGTGTLTIQSHAITTLAITQNANHESMDSSIVGSQTSDLDLDSQSVTSESYCCIPEMLREHQDNEDCEFVKVQTLGNTQYTLKCTDVVEC